MPYAIRHGGTGELLAGAQTNAYQLSYYGLLLWDDEPDEATVFEALTKSNRYQPSAAEAPQRERHAAEWEQVKDLRRWKPVLLTEHEAKLGNVKLRNDEGQRVYLRDGSLAAEPIAGTRSD